MSHGPNRTTRTRDEESFTYDLSNAIYGSFPSCATDISPLRSRASSQVSKTLNKSKTNTTSDLARQNIELVCNLPQQQSSRGRDLSMSTSIHHSTCLNLNAGAQDGIGSDIWILPELEDWEVDEKASTPARSDPFPLSACAAVKQGDWSSLLHRTANSNFERLRHRLETDGWDFIHGRFSNSSKSSQMNASATQSEESIDDEFDVVVLTASRGA
ncbi:serine-type endopeptidase [Pyrenophora seminiperda CCB06]|uniref:Serine-type endopeptidase n=1 Tax=Pyrenophora seminiperda CCB06 TaxID=1302712 RepID=A0A3M7MCP2_9PLEO|nr:serine-type endopeptidase [Pyrenophora seminiperda CCB06]